MLSKDSRFSASPVRAVPDSGRDNLRAPWSTLPRQGGSSRAPSATDGLPVEVSKRIDDCLVEFVGSRSATLLGVSAELAPVVDAVRSMLGGGKRLRAAFCYWGWLGAGGPDADEGDESDDTVVLAAAALELFHLAALVHDDVMDRSETRRGSATVHRVFSARHPDPQPVGEAEHYGASVAILVGDLCLSWSDELIAACRASDRTDRARAVFDTMRTEVIGGQYLDLLEQTRATTSNAASQRVLRYKSAKYTVEHPLVLGGALGGADLALRQGYAEFGLPVGEAFQLRDDVLGVFGDTVRTGKPIGDDLRQGKKTVLVGIARDRADAGQRVVLERVGDPDLDDEGVGEICAVLRATGALAEVERRIDALVSQGLVELAGLDLSDTTVGALTRLARACSRRAA